VRGFRKLKDVNRLVTNYRYSIPELYFISDHMYRYYNLDFEHQQNVNSANWSLIARRIRQEMTRIRKIKPPIKTIVI